MAFRVGQKVVCVNAMYTDAEDEQELIEGEIYILRWVGMSALPDEEPSLSVRLVGIDRGPDEWMPELVDTPFSAERFRPVVERKTDISIFTAMLRTDRVPA